MIKMRLMGPPAQVNALADTLEELGFDVRSRSEEYANRGRSKDVRIYLEIEPEVVG